MDTGKILWYSDKSDFIKRTSVDLQKEIEGISAKMLSSELKDLEINQLVTRTVLSTQPITVEYELTEYGRTLKKIIEHLAEWGIQHRKQITGKVLENVKPE